MQAGKNRDIEKKTQRKHENTPKRKHERRQRRQTDTRLIETIKKDQKKK